LTFKKGHKYQFTEETRKKPSLQKMGSKNPNFGKKLSEKTRKDFLRNNYRFGFI